MFKCNKTVTLVSIQVGREEKKNCEKRWKQRTKYPGKICIKWRWIVALVISIWVCLVDKLNKNKKTLQNEIHHCFGCFYCRFGRCSPPRLTRIKCLHCQPTFRQLTRIWHILLLVSTFRKILPKIIFHNGFCLWTSDGKYLIFLCLCCMQIGNQ